MAEAKQEDPRIITKAADILRGPGEHGWKMGILGERTVSLLIERPQWTPDRGNLSVCLRIVSAFEDMIEERTPTFRVHGYSFWGWIMKTTPDRREEDALDNASLILPCLKEAQFVEGGYNFTGHTPDVRGWMRPGNYVAFQKHLPRR